MPIVTGNTTSSYEGSGIPLWEEASKVSDVNSEDTVTSENIAEDTVRKICDWTNIYGKLESGEYDFSLTVEGFYIRIKFTVNENGGGTDEKVFGRIQSVCIKGQHDRSGRRYDHWQCIYINR